MQKKSRHQQLGISLLELLLVLAVISAITFLGINRYQNHKRQTELAQVQQNVQLIFQAASVYYRVNCMTGTTFQISMALLEQNKPSLLPALAKTKLVKPWQNGKYDYDLSAIKLPDQTSETEQDIYQLIVKADLNVPANEIEWYKTRLGAYSASGTTLTWRSMPSYQQKTMDTNLWVMDSGLGYFKAFIEGKDATNKRCAY